MRHQVTIYCQRNHIESSHSILLDTRYFLLDVSFGRLHSSSHWTLHSFNRHYYCYCWTRFKPGEAGDWYREMGKSQ